MGRPHDLGNISKYLGKPTHLEDYIGWLANNFDPSISWKDLEWIREFWKGPMIIKGILDPQDAKDAVQFSAPMPSWSPTMAAASWTACCPPPKRCHRLPKPWAMS